MLECILSVPPQIFVCYQQPGWCLLDIWGFVGVHYRIARIVGKLLGRFIIASLVVVAWTSDWGSDEGCRFLGGGCRKINARAVQPNMGSRRNGSAHKPIVGRISRVSE